jgi:hypothetical protein
MPKAKYARKKNSFMAIPQLIINSMFRRNLLDRITIKKIQRRHVR